MEDKPLNNPDYYKAQLLLEEKMPGFDQSRETIVIDSDLLIDDPKYAAFVGTVVEDLNGFDDIHEGAVSYFQDTSSTDGLRRSKDDHYTSCSYW